MFGIAHERERCAKLLEDRATGLEQGSTTQRLIAQVLRTEAERIRSG